MRLTDSTITAWLATLSFWSAVVTGVSIPGCQTTAPQEQNLTNVATMITEVPSHPFGVAYAQNDEIAFVALNTSLGVLNTTTLPARLIHEVALPTAYLNDSITTYRFGILEGATGITLSHNGRYVLVTAFSTWLIIVDVAKAIAGSPDAVVGAVNGTTVAGNSAIEVVTTSNDRYAFVSQEDGSAATNFTNGTIEVLKLHGLNDYHGREVSGVSIGFVTLGELVVGMALSPDDRYLYVTSEGPANTTTPQGTLSVLDVETLKHDPGHALLSTVTAGCGAVRTIVSKDGKTVWVTLRESNHLVGFDAGKLVSCPEEALLASVQVGRSPVGLVFARNETRILTADSNRFESTNTTSGISVVDVEAALRGEKTASLGQIPSGRFPREFASSPNGETVLMSVYGSEEIQAIDVATLP